LVSEGVFQQLLSGQQIQEIDHLLGVATVVSDDVVLDGQLHGVADALGLGLHGPVLHADEVGDGDGRQETEDDHNDHQLDESKALAIEH